MRACCHRICQGREAPMQFLPLQGFVDVRGVVSGPAATGQHKAATCVAKGGLGPVLVVHVHKGSLVLDTTYV